MKILLLANSASAHTQKWALGLASQGIDVGIFSLNPSEMNWCKGVNNISVLYQPSLSVNNKKVLTKLFYMRNVKKLKKVIVEFKPDIVHAHYATSYGMLGMLSKFKPFVVSVWGADVYDFPKKSFLHKKTFSRIVDSATQICSTSNCMKEEILLYTNKSIEVVPFGVDVDSLKKLVIPDLSKDEITIGTIKSLEPKYGIDYLIKAFALVVKQFPSRKLKLLIVGDGSYKAEYVNLVSSLGISTLVNFTGKVPHAQVVDFLAKIDVFVSLSVLDSESFGVSLVEAMAASKPIIASDVAGFKEVLGEETNGIIVPRRNEKAAADAIGKLINDSNLAKNKGVNAQQRAVKLYNWQSNINQMITIYEKLLSKELKNKN